MNAGRPHAIGAARDPARARDGRRSFTVVELLAVLGILAVLMTLLVPVAGRVRDSARVARTRVQFQQWAAALEAFRAEYGCYPQLLAQKVNGGSSRADAGGISDADTLYREILTGRGTAAGAPPAFRSTERNLATGTPAAQNRRRIAFLTFAGDEIEPGGRVTDAFGNTDIAVVFDTDGDGIIPADAINAVTVGSADQPGVLAGPPAAALPAGGVRAGVVFFSAGAGWSGPGAIPENLVLSWR